MGLYASFAADNGGIKIVENSDKKISDLKNFLERSKASGQTLVSSTGYVNLVFSPAASRQPEAQDKLAVCCTFAEWKAIGKLLEAECEIPWSSWCTNEYIGFLREAIASIPAEKTGLIETPILGGSLDDNLSSRGLDISVDL